MLHRKRFLSLAAVATLAVAGVACDDGGTDTDLDTTEDTLDGTGDTLEDGAEDTGDTLEEGGDEMEEELDEETEGDS